MVWSIQQSYHRTSLSSRKLIAACRSSMYRIRPVQQSRLHFSSCEKTVQTPAHRGRTLVLSRRPGSNEHIQRILSVYRVSSASGRTVTTERRSSFVKQELKAFRIDVDSLISGTKDLWFHVKLLNGDNMIVWAYFRSLNSIYDSPPFRQYLRDNITEAIEE